MPAAFQKNGNARTVAATAADRTIRVGQKTSVRFTHHDAKRRAIRRNHWLTLGMRAHQMGVASKAVSRCETCSMWAKRQDHNRGGTARGKDLYYRNPQALQCEFGRNADVKVPTRARYFVTVPCCSASWCTSRHSSMSVMRSDLSSSKPRCSTRCAGLLQVPNSKSHSGRP